MQHLSQYCLTPSTHIPAFILRTVNAYHYKVAFLRVDLGNGLWLYAPCEIVRGVVIC